MRRGLNSLLYEIRGGNLGVLVEKDLTEMHLRLEIVLV